MKPSLRVYGEITGVTLEQWEGADCVRIRRGLFLEKLAHEGGRIVLEHEGWSVDLEDVEELLRFAAGAMGPEGSGHCDYIDDEGRELTRFVIRPGQVAGKTLPIDAVLEGMTFF